jgi:hypothetical protein
MLLVMIQWAMTCYGCIIKLCVLEFIILDIRLRVLPQAAEERVVQQAAAAGNRRQLKVVSDEDGGGAA